MKKIIFLVFIMLLLVPISVKANIRCNDGTISPSCGDCHRGCCSRHGGCSSNSNSGSYNNNYTTRRATTTTTTTTRTTYIPPTTVETSDSEDDSDSVIGGLLFLGVAGATAYGINKSRKKK